MPERRCRTGKGRAFLIGALAVFGLAHSVSAQIAVRDLSDFNTYTQPLTVVITVTPPVGTFAYGIEDAPPSGWIDVSDIDNGGSWDAVNKKVKWGPYFTDQPITLHYALTPPTPVTGGTPCFRGVVSVDGNNQQVAGTLCLPAPVPTISEWGLACVALALLIAGTLLLRHRVTPMALGCTHR